MRLSILVSLACAIACKPSETPAPRVESVAPVAVSPVAPAAAPPPGVAAAAALKGELKAALEEAMQRGGPVGAIDVCKDKGQSIAAAHSKDGVVVGRTSHKLRNPANAPSAWVQPVLDEWVKADPATLTPRTLALDGGRIGYVEPILTGPVCLSCHGAVVAPELQSKLAAAYPNDAATGFQPGALRGVVWVELSAASPSP